MELKQSLIEHYKFPHNQGTLKEATHIIEEGNQSCGDLIKLYLIVANSTIADVKFKGLGCAISIASTSLLTDYIKGKSLEEIKKLDSQIVFDLLGTKVSPGRLKCALLPLEALKKI